MLVASLHPSTVLLAEPANDSERRSKSILDLCWGRSLGMAASSRVNRDPYLSKGDIHEKTTKSSRLSLKR